MKKLIFNNKSIEEIGFVVVEGSPEILAQEDYESVNVEGRNGSMIINKNTYPDIEKTFTITAKDFDFDDDNIGLMIDKLKKWLFDVEDNRLFYAYKDRYNIVKKVIISKDITTTFEEWGELEVTFLCEPFYYAVENKIDTDLKSMIIQNDGDFESYPNIKIYGVGDVELTINSNTVTIKNVSSYVELDSKLFLCVDMEGNSKTKDMIGNFLTLDRGINRVSCVGEVTNIVIIPRTIYR